MAKDPAFLMYYQDWLVGTSYMTYEQKGKYIDLLCHQADKETIPEHIAHSICTTEEDRKTVLDAKFIFEEHYYYNEKMLEITTKRRAYSESRRKNRMNTNKTYEKTSNNSLPHMENENENETVNKTKTKRFIKPTLKELVEYKMERGSSVDLTKFLNYYESNGWRVGRNPMRDWKAAYRNWERSDFSQTQAVVTPPKSKLLTEQQDNLPKRGK